MGEVDLFIADPELAAALRGIHRERLAASLRAPALHLPVGPWTADTTVPVCLGLLVIDGALAMRTALTPSRAHLELLGPGDVLQPWVGVDEDAVTPRRPDWRVLEAATLAVLDARFAKVCAVYPSILREVIHRLVLRSRRLNLQMAVNTVPGVPERLHLLLWHLAQRFGHVTPGGIVITLPLVHQMLADMVGARRPSVSTAIGALARSGVVTREAAGRFVLHGKAPALLGELYGAAALPAPALA